MSYCRFSAESDVYLYVTGTGADAPPDLADLLADGTPDRWLCVGCSLAGENLVHRALADAPIDDEPISESEERAVQEALDQIARGESITNEELRSRLGMTDPVDRSAVVLDSAKEALGHLLAHRAAGHKVPQSAIDRLVEEAGAVPSRGGQ